MKKFISICCIVCLMYGIVFSGACYAASLTDKEVIEAAKLLKALSLENENLKTQVFFQSSKSFMKNKNLTLIGCKAYLFHSSNIRPENIPLSKLAKYLDS